MSDFPLYDAFISYSHSDGAEHLGKLVTSLESTGHRIWYDKIINKTRNFNAEIQTAINHSSVFLLALTKSVTINLHSYVHEEVHYALSRQQEMFVLKFPGVDNSEVPIRLASKTRIDFSDFENGLDKLLEDLKLFRHLRSHYQDIEFRLEQVTRQPISRNFTTRPQPIRHSEPPRKLSTEGLLDTLETGSQHIMLLGESGIGKSTSLLAITKRLLVSRLTESGPIPFYTSIASWGDIDTDQNYYEWLVDSQRHILEWLARQTRILDRDYIETQIRKENVLLILDGLDDLPTVRAESEHSSISDANDLKENFLNHLEEDILKKWSNNIVIISCRTEVYKDDIRGGFKNQFKNEYRFVEIDLDELLPSQTEAYFSDLSALFEVVKNNEILLDLLSNPLWMKMFKEAFQVSDTWDECQKWHGLGKHAIRNNILASYIRYKYSTLDRSVRDTYSLEKTIELLGKLAASLAIKGETSRTQFTLKTVHEALDSEDIEEFLGVTKGKLNLIDQVSQEQEVYQFYHNLLFDYFLIHYCTSALEIDNPTQTRCDAAKALGTIRSYHALDILLRALETDPNPNVHYTIIEAIQSYPARRAIEPLTQFAQIGIDKNVQELSCLTLAEFGGNDKFKSGIRYNALITAIQYGNSTARYKAYGYLNHVLKEPRVKDFLIERWDIESGENSWEIRIKILTLITRWDDRKVIDIIVEALDDDNVDVKLDAVNRLKILFDQFPSSEFRNYLRNQALEKLEYLIGSVSHSKEVKVAALITLETMEGIDFIINLAKNEQDDSTRYFIVTELTQWKVKLVIEALIEFLNDPYWPIRAESINKLGALFRLLPEFLQNTIKSRATILESLYVNDPVIEVRQAASTTLDKLTEKPTELSFEEDIA